MNRHFIETLTGALVLLVAGWFLYFFLSKTTEITKVGNHYTLYAKFQQSDGISLGSPIRIGGVKVGVVTDIELEKATYFSKIALSIDNNIKIPVDSSAKIVSSGLLGDKYISIEPGADEEMLEENKEIKYTQSSINFESLIGKALFNKDK